MMKQKSLVSFTAIAFPALVMYMFSEPRVVAENGESSGLGKEASEVRLFETVANGNPKLAVGYIFDPARQAIVPWIVESRENLAVVDGDIVLGSIADLRNPDFYDTLVTKGLQDLSGRLWPLAIVAYELPLDFPNRGSVLKALDEYNTRTKIKFVPRSAATKFFIRFELTDNSDIGGQSSLGRVDKGDGKGQALWLSSNLEHWTTATVIHELGHALGLAHEQNREDRDQYVEILLENVKEPYRSQFIQLFRRGKDVGPYDYSSIMHYPSNAFHKDGSSITIKVKQGNAEIGKAVHLSDGDISTLNTIYAGEIAKRE